MNHDIYTIQTGLHCLNSSMPIYVLLGKVRADELLSKGTPLLIVNFSEKLTLLQVGGGYQAYGQNLQSSV